MATLNIKAFPDELHEALRTQAEREHRSLAQQVIHLLELSVVELPRLPLADLRGLGKETWEGIDPAEHVAAERDAWD